MSKDATVRVKWEKNKSNLWVVFRQKATSRKVANDDMEERTERTAQDNGAGSIASFEDNRDDENVKPQSENTNHQVESSNKREGDAHASQPHKETVDLTKSLSKLKKKIKIPLDGASISIRSSFSCSFGEIMKNKAYKEIVDEQRNEKEDDAALMENEFDLIANRKSREGLEGTITENKWKENDPAARESSTAAYKSLEDFLEKKNRRVSPTSRIQDEAIYGIAESVEEKTDHKTFLSESVYTIGNVKSGEVKTERAEEASKYHHSDAEGYDADAIFFQTSQSQTTGTETYVDDQTTRYQDSQMLNSVLRRTACCVTEVGSGLISRALPSRNSSSHSTSTQIQKYSIPPKDNADNDFLPVELAIHGEKTVIQVDGQQVCDVRFLRGRRVFRLERNKLKGRRIFSSKRVYESVKGRREELVIPKEQSTLLEIEYDELPQNAQVTRLTKGRKKLNVNNGKNVGLSRHEDVIMKTEGAFQASKKKGKKTRKEQRSNNSRDDVEGYSADEEDEGGHRFKASVGPGYRHLHPGKSIYWLKVGDGVEKSLKLNNSPASEKSVYWLKVGEEVPQTI
jgi:hypothetical protein